MRNTLDMRADRPVIWGIREAVHPLPPMRRGAHETMLDRFSRFNLPLKLKPGKKQTGCHDGVSPAWAPASPTMHKNKAAADYGLINKERYWPARR